MNDHHLHRFSHRNARYKFGGTTLFIFHPMNLPAAIGIVAISLFLGRCSQSSATPDMVTSFGTTFSPDATKKLVVTRQEVSLVDFQVLDARSGKELVKDYIGSDAMRWFLHWETPTRLWGYGSDIGYFKLFEFQADGTVKTTRVNEQTPVPRIVWDNLPSVIQERHKMATGG